MRKSTGLLTASALLVLTGTAFADGIPDISGGAVATLVLVGLFILFLGIALLVGIVKALDKGVDKALEIRRERAKQRALAPARIVSEVAPASRP